MKVTKGFLFESAHRLSDYEGKCKRIHGHNYRGVVTAESKDLDETGMVIDFSDLKKVIKEVIIEPFDHRLILKIGDPINEDIDSVLSPYGDTDWIVWVEYNPTAENMAEDFLRKLRKQIPEVTRVELFETDDSSAIAEVELQKS